uniref:Uncharacterized protein n=1 Tax=Aliarcobacter butzleri TaxID=28197 RepID=W0LZF2_9BACT|nr:hypothetical protein [Aliarcobacter butzleri]
MLPTGAKKGFFIEDKKTKVYFGREKGNSNQTSWLELI